MMVDMTAASGAMGLLGRADFRESLRELRQTHGPLQVIPVTPDHTMGYVFDAVRRHSKAVVVVDEGGGQYAVLRMEAVPGPDDSTAEPADVRREITLAMVLALLRQTKSGSDTLRELVPSVSMELAAS